MGVRLVQLRGLSPNILRLPHRNLLFASHHEAHSTGKTRETNLAADGDQAWHRSFQYFISVVHHPFYPKLLVHCLNITGEGNDRDAKPLSQNRANLTRAPV